MKVRRRAAPALLALAALAYCGLFAANSLIRVRTFTADSMNYVDVARRVAGGDGLVQSTGGFNQPFYLSGDLDLPAAFTAQPPGYPLVIAFLARLGVETADAALVVSALGLRRDPRARLPAREADGRSGGRGRSHSAPLSSTFRWSIRAEPP